MAGMGSPLDQSWTAGVLYLDMAHKSCEVCGDKLTSGERRFCSRTCQWTMTTRQVECETCHKSFSRPVSTLTYKRIFCSAPCRITGMRLASGLDGFHDGTWHIPLVGGESTIVDEDVHRSQSAHRWYENKAKGTCYAVRAGGPGEPKTVILHRVIMAAPPGLQVDHINCNGLDNRRENLRLVEPVVNCRNTRGWRNRASKYKGVHKYQDRWEAEFKVLGKRYRLGRFTDQEEAARAYDAGVREVLGSDGRYNFPREGERSALWEP